MTLYWQEKKRIEREERKKRKAQEKARVEAERQENFSTAKGELRSSDTRAGSSFIQAKRDSIISRSLSTASISSVEVLYEQGVAGTGQPYVEYPQLDLQFYALFALGSPIGMFLTVR